MAVVLVEAARVLAPGTAQLNAASIWRQFSKWPISSDIATLYVWTLHVFPRVFAVEYSGWNAYGASRQVGRVPA